MWNDDWRTELAEINSDCFLRLCECRNKRSDVAIIASLMYKYNKDTTAKECLDRTFEWLCDWNNQYELEPTQKEYKSILAKIN